MESTTSLHTVKMDETFETVDQTSDSIIDESSNLSFVLDAKQQDPPQMSASDDVDISIQNGEKMTQETTTKDSEMADSNKIEIPTSGSTENTDVQANEKQQPTSSNKLRLDTFRMKEYLKKAKKATSEYNKMINQERKNERRICLDLQTYTLHYPLGLGAENRMLKKHIQSGLCEAKGKYPISLLPGHYQNNYRKYTSEELKYFPLNTVIYGPVITDVDKLPPLLTRIEEDSFSDSDSNSSVSSDHSCCCDETACKKLKLENGCANNAQKCNCLEKLSSSSSSSSEDEQEDLNDEQPPKLVNVFHFAQRENATCEACKKGDVIRPDGRLEKLIHCSDCISSFHPTCLEMTPEMIQQIQLYPWQCSQCKHCVICSNDHFESNLLICDLCDKASHAMCVGLKNVPLGKWFCKLCTVKQKFIKS